MQSSWRPDFGHPATAADPERVAPADAQSGALYERLLAALERDIRSGALAPGTKLPPHRALAFDLGVSVGTVTRAYAEAERRGLVTAHVGRGSFVAGPAGARAGFGFAASPTEGIVDLARNIPPLGAAQRRLADALVRLRRRADLLDAVNYPPPDGLPAHRAAVAAWLARRHGLDAEPGRIVLTAGAQQALSLAFSVLCRPGDEVLCEAATFVGVKAIAEQHGYRLRGVPLDAEGLRPDALDRAAAAGGARVLYVIPTLQNPTGALMSAGRRAEIAAVARRRNLAVIEDDVYAVHVDAAVRPPPLASLAPERVWHAASVSKSLSPGLRLGFLVPPTPEQHEAVLRALRASCYSTATLPALLVAQWIEDGAADSIADETVAETRARVDLARAILGERLVGAEGRPYAPHLWLPMSELEAERVAGRALRAGVEVLPPSAPIVDAAAISGLRACVGGPADLATLERGLRALAAALASDREEAGRVAV